MSAIKVIKKAMFWRIIIPATEEGWLWVRMFWSPLSWKGANLRMPSSFRKNGQRRQIHLPCTWKNSSINIRDTKLNVEITTYDIPNVGEEN